MEYNTHIIVISPSIPNALAIAKEISNMEFESEKQIEDFFPEKKFSVFTIEKFVDGCNKHSVSTTINYLSYVYIKE